MNDTTSWQNYCSITGNTVKPVLRGHLGYKEKETLKDRWPLKRSWIYMTGQKKSDLLIQVTA